MHSAMSNTLKQLKAAVAQLADKDLFALAEWCQRLADQRRYEALCDDTTGIRHQDVLKEFRNELCPLRGLDTEQAAGAMEDFYRATRVQGCRIEDEADMLLVEWGLASRIEYYVAYTRQLIPPRPDGGVEVWQLRLELRFPLTPELRAQKGGNRWFESPRKLDSFIKFTYTARPFSRLSETRPSKVTLTYRNAE